MALHPMPATREEWLEIPLTQGQFAMVDLDAPDRITSRRWFAARARNTFYAHHSATISGATVTIRMHREIVSAPAGVFVDHINGNTLDNRTCNLRLCTSSENSRNAKPRVGKSAYKGVNLSNTGNRWCAMICLNGRLQFLGSFISERDAAVAYDEAAIKHFGQFARVNFPDQRMATQQEATQCS